MSLMRYIEMLRGESYRQKTEAQISEEIKEEFDLNL